MMKSLKAASRGVQVAAQRRPAFGSARPARRAQRVAAAAEDAPAAASSSALSPPLLEWPVDNETIKDVFAFAGSAPERVNGRAAMMGFVAIMLAEHSSKTPALESIGGDFFGVALLSLAITLGSIFPKFASGSSLKVRMRVWILCPCCNWGQLQKSNGRVQSCMQ
ncbi:hypothetical protein Rsub_03663 [Raphidocelis subcapitata]|uniref:Uncharacterized protein n=1 Tax=Raphidocelis subcapitata TaxID=307507 RepID=A0A2V0P0H1_9CHLO|nr:hypothetical protein Rsub_03663 [Raphidocelis subcapitata]|eukprot:GBF91343.1 hypothetical protein Rsub_03663 [Raphidocelis subcapitata]